MRYLIGLILLLILPALAQAKAALTPNEYKLLTQAFASIEAQEYDQAYRQLQAAQPQMRSDYSRALVAHNLGQVELQRERYPQALQHLDRAYRLEALEQAQQLNLTRTLAQLNCMESHWQTCIDHLQHWLKQVPDRAGADDHLLLAQAYSQQEKWPAVIQPLNKAIGLRQPAPQSWYRLLVAAHIQLQQWQAAIGAQRQLLSHYPGEPGHWRQLVSLQMTVEDHAGALATQRLGYEKALLRSARDHRLLSQLMRQAQLPYYAARVLEQGLDRGVLKADRNTLTQLSNSWIQAQEHARAEQALSKLTRIAPDARNLTRLAQIRIQLRRWEQAQQTLLEALQQKGANKARLHLLLGITRVQLTHYQDARQAFAQAATDKNLKSAADNWLNYLEQIEPAPGNG